jgi:hypothetical protein
MVQSALSRSLYVLALITFAMAGLPSTSANAVGQSSQASVDEPGTLLARAKAVIGYERPNRTVLHYRAVAASEQNFQSDRMYPPYFSAMLTKEGWFDPQLGAERVRTRTIYPGTDAYPEQLEITDSARAFRINKDQFNALPQTSLVSRYLNPCAVISDWSRAENVRLAGRQAYRDYQRIVLSRPTPNGEQRLFLDPKTGFPVKLEFEEKHYLWGQRHIEYVYSNWILMNGLMMPGSSFRLADGQNEISQTFGHAELIASDTAPSSTLPEQAGQPPDSLPRFLQPIDPTVTQVGPHTYLLSNPGYTEAVTEIRNEVFLFDAAQGEERARKDAAAIAKLFPNSHEVTVVVTDLAWPHVAGVRYWVANGATIIAHKASRDFLQTVVDRRWTAAPDLLEQRRKAARLNFVGIDNSYDLANHSISLHPIDGIGSEVALLAYLTQDHFLWASDYIQTVDEPTSYASEVWTAVQRDGLHPERTAAEHLRLTPWTRIEQLQKKLTVATQ